MSDNNVLTKKIAQQFLPDEEFLDLDEYTAIEDDAAKVLAKHQGDLYLNGLTALSEPGTKALAKHRGLLSLRGLRSLSETAVVNLSQREGDLDLSGLTSLTDASAASLGKFKGAVLCLDGLTNLQHEQAMALAKYQGDLHLNGLTALSSESAEALARHDGTLWLKGLTTISDTALEALSQCNGNLEVAEPLAKALKQITCKITKAIAEKFLTNEDSVDLKEFTEIEDAAAEVLSKHCGALALNGLTSLSDAAAEHLSEHHGRLHLNVFSFVDRQAWSEPIKKLIQAKGDSLEADTCPNRHRFLGSGQPAWGYCSGPRVLVGCGNCGKSDWIYLDLDLGEWRGDVRPSLENEGWKKVSSDNWPSDDVIRCPDCVIKTPCTNCGESVLVSLPGQESPVCMACETDQLKEILGL